MRSMPRRRARALFLSDSPFIETLSIRIPSARTASAEIRLVPQFAGIATVPVDHRRIDSLAVQVLSNPLCAARSLKSAGEDYLGVLDARFSSNSAWMIDFPYENGAGL